MMRKVRFPAGLGFILLLTVGLDTQTIAGDYLSILTSEAYQDAVAIGEIKARRDQTIIFQPTRTLIGKKLPYEITVQIPPNIKPKPFGPGEPAVLTLEKNEKTYILTSEGFMVSDSDPKKAVILSGPLYRDSRFMFQRIINSCGSDRNFFFDGKTVYLQEFDSYDGRMIASVPIGVKEGDRYITLTENPPICPPVRLSLWERFISLLNRITATGKLF